MSEAAMAIAKARGYGNGYAAGVRRGRAELQSATQKKFDALHREIAQLRHEAGERPPAPPADPRARLTMILPGRSETAELLWPRDCNSDDLEMMRGNIAALMARWIAAKSKSAITV